MNISAHSCTAPGKGKGIASSTPPTILTEDIDILHSLAQGMPEFGQASNSPSNLAEQMTHDNHISESFQLEVSGIPSPRAQGSVMLDQSREENRAYPSRKRSIGAATNRRREKKRMLPGVLTAQTPQALQFGQGSNGAANLSYEIVPIKRHNLHQNVPPFWSLVEALLLEQICFDLHFQVGYMCNVDAVTGWTSIIACLHNNEAVFGFTSIWPIMWYGNQLMFAFWNNYVVWT